MEKRERKSMGKKESFILDKSNVAAYMLAGLIVENKKECLINPAIIYAESGNGKSHIVGIIKENLNEKGKKVKVVKADDFTSELIDTIKSNEFNRRDFCKRYDDVDILVIEDMQHLQGKNSTQEYLVDIIESLLEKGNKQLVFTMNCAPDRLERFEERLMAKFSNCVQIQILPPNKNMKKRIIKKWCHDNKQKLSKKSVKRIVKNNYSVGEILGFLKHLELYVQLCECPADKKLVNRVLRERGVTV